MVAVDFLHEIVTLLQMGLGTGETFEAVLHLVTKSVPFESASLFLYNKKSNKLEVIYQEGEEVVDLVRDVPFERGMGMASWVSQQDKPIILESLAKSRPGKDGRFSSFISLPLRAADKLVGVLNLGHSKANIYLQKDIETFSIMASDLSIVTETLILRQQLEKKNKMLSNALQELNEAQGLLIEKERMAAIGEVVVSVNHEINNPLTSIIGLMELLEISFSTMSTEKIQKSLKAVLLEARRIQDVTSRLTHINNSANKDYIGDTHMTVLPE